MQDLGLFVQNHLVLCLALLATIGLLIVVEYLRLRQSASGVSPSQLVRLMNHNKAVVIDIRPSSAFAEGHIIDAVSIPAAELTEKSKKLVKYKNRPIVLMCQLGQESAALANNLIQQGFDAYVLSGGLKAWKEAEMPTIKGK